MSKQYKNLLFYQKDTEHIENYYTAVFYHGLKEKVPCKKTLQS